MDYTSFPTGLCWFKTRTDPESFTDVAAYVPVDHDSDGPRLPLLRLEFAQDIRIEVLAGAGSDPSLIRKSLFLDLMKIAAAEFMKLSDQGIDVSLAAQISGKTFVRCASTEWHSLPSASKLCFLVDSLILDATADLFRRPLITCWTARQEDQYHAASDRLKAAILHLIN